MKRFKEVLRCWKLAALFLVMQPAGAFAQFGTCPDLISEGDRVYMLDWGDKTVGRILGCTFWTGKYKVTVDGETMYFYEVTTLARISGCTGSPSLCVGDYGMYQGSHVTVLGIVVDNQVYVESDEGSLFVIGASAIRTQGTNRPHPPIPPRPPTHPRPQPTPRDYPPDTPPDTPPDSPPDTPPDTQPNPPPNPQPNPPPSEPPAPPQPPMPPNPNPNPPDPSGPKVYHCRIEKDGQVFESQGPSRQEAAQDVLNQCYEKASNCKSSDVACMRSYMMI